VGWIDDERRRCVRPVGHRVVPNRVGHVGGDADPTIGDAVGQIPSSGLPRRWDGPEAVADEAHPLDPRCLERRGEMRADPRRLRSKPLGVQRLGTGRQLRVVQPEFLLEADEFEESPRHADELRSRVVFVAVPPPPSVGDGVELVLQSNDRAVVVKGSVVEFGFDYLRVRLCLRAELGDVDVEDVPDPRRQVTVHTHPCTTHRLETRDSRNGDRSSAGSPRTHRRDVTRLQPRRPVRMPRHRTRRGP
jgi:hypothetical protein